MGSPGEVDAHCKTLVLFDGVCNLCNSTVRFIIKHDREKRFCFSSLQTSFAKSVLLKFGLDPDAVETIVVVDEGSVFVRSDAALKILERLQGIWLAIVAFRIIPRKTRDSVYNFVAKRRYGIFGRSDVCMIPDEKLRSRFIL